MIFNLNKNAFTRNSFVYDGECEFGRGSGGWMMALKTNGDSGKLILKMPVFADVLLVAGGENGHSGGTSGKACFGGNGGEIKSFTSRVLPAGEYTVHVGDGGEDTTFVGPDGISWTAQAGNGKPGGSNDDSGAEPPTTRAGADGDYPWGDSNTLVCKGWRFGASGGRGTYAPTYGININGANGGSVGAANDEATGDMATPGRGGWYSSGSSHTKGYAGFPNAGQGGGGGCHIDGSNSSGGAGGSGIILIRPHKEVSA